MTSRSLKTLALTVAQRAQFILKGLLMNGDGRWVRARHAAAEGFADPAIAITALPASILVNACTWKPAPF